MPINPDAAKNAEWSEGGERSWNSKDALLYAVGVGAGGVDPFFELEFTTENSKDIPQKVLPTFAVIIGGGGGGMRNVGTFNPAMLVHGEQGIELLSPLPVEGTISSVGRVTGVYDKGSGAVIASESESTLKSTGEVILRSTSSVFIRGEGGFGGDRGPSSEKNPVFDTEPDEVVTYQTRPDQAL